VTAPVIIDDIICNEGEGRGSLSICPLPSVPLICVGSPTSSPNDLGQFTLTVAQARWMASVLLSFATAVEMRRHVDDVGRCAVCGWQLAAPAEARLVEAALGCVRGDCSMRPRPATLYAPERAAVELDALIAGTVKP
jgi:hypothetical protein